ncbi:MAG: hypothetical protein ACRCT8_00645 [Lacipirellulaceae bacterium]
MTTAETKTNKPYAKLSDGALRATIWSNTTPDGKTRYSVELSRSYTDAGGAWRDSNRFSRNELLRVAHLAAKAYDVVTAAYAAEPAAAAEQADDGDAQ